jgi:hypothetical protein
MKSLQAVLMSVILLFPTLSLQAGQIRYMTADGAGNGDGSSWAHAYSASQLSATLLNTTMTAGDTLLLGSGNYGSRTLSLASSGTSGNPKSIVGVDTGGGLPEFNGANWSRTDPDAATSQYSVISVGSGASHWSVANLVLRNCRYAVMADSAGATRTGLKFSHLDIQFVRHGFYLSNCDGLVIEDCSVTRYTKHGYRLDRGCDDVSFTRCTADLSAGDATWYDYSEPIPYGFIVNDGAAASPNTNITFTDCVARNNLQNGQDPAGFWNGDGFDSESNTVGLSFVRCIALNNDDAGFDTKQAAASQTVYQDCVAVGNGNNFKVWYGAVDMDNCVSLYPRRRGGAQNDINGLRNQNATVHVDYSTFHGTTGTEYDIAEKSAGTIDVYNSILSFTGSGGGFKLGTVNYGAGTVTYRPGSGTDPAYVNPSASWDGLGSDMDSQTYGTGKGYHAPSGAVPVEVIADNADSTGVTVAGSWVASNATAGYYGAGYLHDNNTGKGAGKYVQFNPDLAAGGAYEVFVRWTSGTNRASNVPIDVTYPGGAAYVQVNQRSNGGQWVSLGTYLFAAGSGGSVRIGTAGTNGYVIADAVRFVPAPVAEVVVDNADSGSVAVAGSWVASSATAGYYGADYLHDNNTGKGAAKYVQFTPDLPAGGSYQVFARWTSGTNRASNVPIDITHAGGTATVQADQRSNGGQWVLLGTYGFHPGTAGTVRVGTAGTNGYVIADSVRLVPLIP